MGNLRFNTTYMGQGKTIVGHPIQQPSMIVLKSLVILWNRVRNQFQEKRPDASAAIIKGSQHIDDWTILEGSLEIEYSHWVTVSYGAFHLRLQTGEKTLSSTPISFDGPMGKLAGILEMADQPTRAFALFAHCFTCSKDFKAAVRIARALCQHGIGVLRFDFAGIGGSEGDFVATTFSSNVDDLICAADYLKKYHRAPALLIGHSLGGAAVLAAAKRLESVRAVATLAAPAGTEYLRTKLVNKAPELAHGSDSEVDISGRPIRIGAKLIEDLQEHNIQNHVRNLDRALMVLHSPADDVVGIDQASLLFVAARHPKSFVSLDKSDHLLLKNPNDAHYVGELIAAWASRYVFDTSEEVPR